MTALNWEQLRRNSMERQYQPDDLPITGSFADQKRYLGFEDGYKRSRYQKSADVVIRNRQFDFDQLEKYSDHALQPDFKRLTSTQRNEIVQIVNKLLHRSSSWSGTLSRHESYVLNRAKLALSPWSH
jgi:hypothetical protein